MQLRMTTVTEATYFEHNHLYFVRELRFMEEETEQKHQCISCGQWFDECDIIGEVCADCHVAIIEEEEEV